VKHLVSRIAQRVFLALSAAVICGRAVEAGLNFDQGLQNYNQKKLAAAAQCFAADIKKGSGNSKTFYYLANCLYGMRRLDEAIQTYWYLTFTYPSSAEAYTARGFLKRIDVNYNKDVANANLRAMPKLNGIDLTPEANIAVAQESKGVSQSQKKAIVEAIVLTVRGNAGRPDVTPGLVSKVKEALLSYPTNLLSLVYSKGCKIYLTPTLIDKEPGLQNTKPSGYEDGSTFKNCPGMFQHGNEIVVCELALSNRDDEWVTMEDPLGTLRHELGHAVDWYLGDLSATEEYKHLYRLESAKIDESVKPSIDYFLQRDFRGPSETFAELMCFEYGGRNTTGKEKTTETVHTSFPELSNFIRKKIADIPQR
jgi:tetratricopeptide (TPR) repeat protein